MTDQLTQLLGNTDAACSRRKLVALIAGGVAVTALSGTFAKAQSMDGMKNMAASAEGMVGAEDYATKTLKIGGLALETSKIAKDKASNPSVKQFAELEAAEQEAVASVLTANGATLPKMSETQKQKVAALTSLSGKDFDMKYLEMQMEGHEKLLKVQESKLDGSLTDQQVIVAKLAAPSIKTHLVMLNMIKSMMT